MSRLRRRRGPGLWPFWAALASVIAIGVAVAATAGLLLWIGLGRPSMAGHAPLTAAELLDLTRIALVVTGGIGGVVALVVAYRRQRLHEQAEVRESGRLFNERFVAASAQLGHDAAAVRLAGAYAMAGLADEWPDQLHACVDVLCAYLRLPYAPDRDADGWRTGEREVRLSIIRIIGDHLRPSARTNWRDHNFDFTGAVFDGGDLDEAIFTGRRVSFQAARFIGGVLHLERARFLATVSFADAQFGGGTVDLRGAEFAMPPVFSHPADQPPPGLLLAGQP
ncbi:pentapeptide repeat-containing protein [Dactylosporangium sp. NBC_01737]|uniref:pentapeptide repeat-containing protein n=1 Tax=Dactylosporangium sp. NBC_01737 TaxID=2975959 RepID=UPI002E146DF5|nr:pentapeptide repeat-containing protein [Dactylosporangium sp. NBC_01737]